MALHTLLQQKTFQVAALLTTVTETYDRIAMHGVRRELLQRQAESIGLPLHEVLIPPQCVNPIYEARMEEALRIHLAQGVRTVAFGDIFLEDLRAYREKNLARVGMTALFPIWKRDTRELIRHFHEQRFRAIAACIDTKILDPSFAGRELDESFFRDLPPQVDPCGEKDRKSTRLNSSHGYISYAVFCLKKKKKIQKSIADETQSSLHSHCNNSCRLHLNYTTL